MNFAQMMTRRFDGPVLENGNLHQDAWLHAVVTLLVILILAGVAVYLIKTMAQNKTTETEKRDPIDYAKERFAKGEISKEELAEIKKELK